MVAQFPTLGPSLDLLLFQIEYQNYLTIFNKIKIHILLKLFCLKVTYSN